MNNRLQSTSSSTLFSVDSQESTDFIFLGNLDLGLNFTITELKETLNKKPSASQLWLEYNQIGDDCMSDIVKLLKIYTNITVVLLYGNNIGDEGAKLIADMLSTTNHLIELNLCSNKISCKGAKYLKNALKKNKSLTSLCLNNNKIGNKGIKYILNGLCSNNTTLKELTISYNRIEATTDSIELICEFLRNNQILNELLINGIIMDENARNLIITAFGFNRSITVLNLHFGQQNIKIREICERNKHNLKLRLKSLVDL